MNRIWGIEKITLSPFYFNSLRLKYVLDALKNVNGKILEIGGGAGAFTRAIKRCRPDLEIICSDIDSNLIKLAKKMDNKNSYIQADAQKIPFENNYFEAVVAFDVIEHLQNPEKSFTEIIRVLKNKGVFHTSIPLEGNILTLHGLFLKIGIKPKEKYAGHIQHFTTKNIIGMLKNAGFLKIGYNFSGHIFYQLVDFSYFSLLSLLKKKNHHTVEGYVETLPKGVIRTLILVTKLFLSVIIYIESIFLKKMPGQIGHFSAHKI
ncbi:MAG: class I SAM-dependent methyltransferase [Candidatus Levybacteria bacterium]|nr:class I SAM-dependent methyltransferase [Candidatus Levybacteria bacterium]